MGYDYIKRVYGVHPIPGRMALHTETGEVVRIMRERPSHGHYVRIRRSNVQKMHIATASAEGVVRPAPAGYPWRR